MRSSGLEISTRKLGGVIVKKSSAFFFNTKLDGFEKICNLLALQLRSEQAVSIFYAEFQAFYRLRVGVFIDQPAD